MFLIDKYTYSSRPAVPVDCVSIYRSSELYTWVSSSITMYFPTTINTQTTTGYTAHVMNGSDLD